MKEININYENLMSTIKHFQIKLLHNQRKCEKIKEDLKIFMEIKKLMENKNEK